MNKKIFIVIAIIILLVLFFILFPHKEEPTNPTLPSTPVITDEEKIVEVTDSDKIKKIKTDSYLNILLQIKTFDKLNISYEPLLEAAMRIARELDLYQTPDNGTYIEYVPRSVVHDLIYELTDIRINQPIVVEDYSFYNYDANGDYYYIVPQGTNWLDLKEISFQHIYYFLML